MARSDAPAKSAWLMSLAAIAIVVAGLVSAAALASEMMNLVDQSADDVVGISAFRRPPPPTRAIC